MNACKRALWKSVKSDSAREQEQIAGCGTVGSVDFVIIENSLDEIYKSKLLFKILVNNVYNIKLI